MSPADLLKALATAAFVALLLVLLRRAGPRAAGLSAALPVTSMPALFWLGLEHGGDYAADAAVGALWATGLTAALAWIYARLCVARGAAWGVALGLPGVAALAWATQAIATTLVWAGVLALAVIVMARRQLPQPGTPLQRHSDWRVDALLSASVAAAMTSAVCALSQRLEPALCGLLAAVPVVAMSAVFVTHRQGGTPLVCRFLLSYLNGMFAKAAFLAALGLALGQGMGASAAWPMALSCALLTLVVQGDLRRLSPRGTAGAAPPSPPADRFDKSRSAHPPP